MLARDDKSIMPDVYGEEMLFKQPFNLLKLYNMNKGLSSLRLFFMFIITFFAAPYLGQRVGEYLIYCSVRDQIWSMNTVSILSMRKWPS